MVGPKTVAFTKKTIHSETKSRAYRVQPLQLEFEGNPVCHHLSNEKERNKNENQPPCLRTVMNEDCEANEIVACSSTSKQGGH